MSIVSFASRPIDLAPAATADSDPAADQSRQAVTTILPELLQIAMQPARMLQQMQQMQQPRRAGGRAGPGAGGEIGGAPTGGMQQIVSPVTRSAASTIWCTAT